jgi:HlyD family secretion protein
MTSRTSRIVGASAAAVVLAAVVAGAVIRDQRSRVKVQTGTAGRTDLVATVSASGEVKPRRFVDVSANVSGRITHLLVDEGDPVHTGQVLARIDSTRFEADTAQARAGVQAARADLERAAADLAASRLSFKRVKEMHDVRLVADQALDQADADLKMKQAQVESQRKRIAQQEAALASMRDNLEKTVVVSPMDGVVTSLKKEEGEVVIGAQSFQPTVIMTIGDLSTMEAEVLVDETDIRYVRLGQPAEVRVDAFDGVTIHGEVTEIGASAIPRGGTTTGTSASSTNQAKDFKVVVTLSDPPENLRPGLNATADITTATRKEALAVPIQAVVVREVDGSGKVLDSGTVQAAEGEPSAPRGKAEEKDGVFVVANGSVRFRPVKTGILGETEIEILDGLSEGEPIVTGSYKTLRTLKDGARIKIDNGRDRS